MARPEGPGPGEREVPKPTPRRRRRADWWKRRLRLAMRALEALNRASDPEHPHRGHWHERETGRVLFLRWRYKRGAWAGVEDRADPASAALPPVAPLLEGAAIVGYCRACGDDLFERADLCRRCAGLTTAIPKRFCQLCTAVIGPEVPGEICPRCEMQISGGF